MLSFSRSYLNMTQLTDEMVLQSDDSLQGPYPQFLLFGDSITQWSCKQELGFNFMPALQDGIPAPVPFSVVSSTVQYAPLSLC